MAEPSVLPLRSPMSFEAGTREAILSAWDNEIGKYRVNLRFGAQVGGIEGAKGAFKLKLSDGSAVEAEAIVLGIGLPGNLRKLGVAGESLDGVQYQLDDTNAFEGGAIVVVGADHADHGSTLALAEQNSDSWL